MSALLIAVLEYSFVTVSVSGSNHSMDEWNMVQEARAEDQKWEKYNYFVLS